MAGLNTAQIIDLAKSQGINLSDSQAQPILSQAWDQSQYGADRGKVESLLSSMRPAQTSQPQTSQTFQPFSGGGATSVTSGSTFNFEDTIKKALEMQKQAVQPAIQSLQAGIPEIQQRFAQTTQQVQAEIDPLKQRYESLLEEVRQRGTQQEQAQTKVTSQELGKRGLVGSSTLAQQEIQNAVLPIQQATTGTIKDVTLSREEGIRNLQNILSNLPQQETESIRAVQKAIAQLQSEAAQTGIGQGIQVGQFGAQQQLAQQQLAASQAQAQAQQLAQQQQLEMARQEAERQAQQRAIENALQQRMFEEVTIPSTQYQINAPYYKPDSGGGLTAQDFLGIFGGTTQTPQATQTTGFSNVDSLLAQGKFNEARQLLLNP